MIEEERRAVIGYTHIHHSLLHAATYAHKECAATQDEQHCVHQSAVHSGEMHGRAAQEQPSCQQRQKQYAAHTGNDEQGADTAGGALGILHVTEDGCIELELPELIEHRITAYDDSQQYGHHREVGPKHPSQRQVAPPHRYECKQQRQGGHISRRTDIHGKPMPPHLPGVGTSEGRYIGIVHQKHHLAQGKEEEQAEPQAQQIQDT